MTPLVHMVAIVVGLAGVAKAREPRPARQLLRQLGWSVPPGAIRLLGMAELALAGAVIVHGGAIGAGALAALHVGFTVVVLASMGTGGEQGCGCFGARRDVAPGALHLAANVGSTAVCVVAAFSPIDPISLVLGDGLGQALAHACVVAVGAGLLVALYTDAAVTAAAVRTARTRRTGRSSSRGPVVA